MVTRASLLVAVHVTGDLNVLGDIPSSSFGYSQKWHGTSDSEFLSLISSKFPLPHKSSLKGIYELGKKAYPMGEWKQFFSNREKFGGSDVTIGNLSDLTHTWRKSISRPKQGLQQY